MNSRDFIFKIILRLKPKPSRKNSKLMEKSRGFTLIELLVALLIAFLILTPLMGLMVNILSTDKEEQAKANTEDDIQTAINYIARDLQQAIYVYDADGIAAIASQLRYPSDTTKTPILVFWKRELVTGVVPSATANSNDDTFIYSLVAYYLDNSTSTTWSKAARISRWQIKNGVENSATGSVSCTGYTKTYVSGYCPDAGFASFNDYFLDTDKLTVGMKKWKKASASYTNDAVVLIDFVDQSTSSVPAATCPPDVTDPTDSTKKLIEWSVVAPTNMTGFYACVDKTNNVTSQVFIRGNALARNSTNASQILYSDAKKSYFPTVNVRVQGRGYLYK